MIQLLLAIIEQINHIFVLIRQSGISPKSSWFHIDHLRHFQSCFVLWRYLISPDIWFPIGVSDGFWKKFTLFYFYVSKLRWKLEVFSMQIYNLPCCQEFLVHAVRIVTLWEFDCYSLDQLSACVLEFSRIFLKIWSEPSILEVNILCLNALWDTFHNIYPVWGYCGLPREWEYRELIIKQNIELRWGTTSSRV